MHHKQHFKKTRRHGGFAIAVGAGDKEQVHAREQYDAFGEGSPDEEAAHLPG